MLITQIVITGAYLISASFVSENNHFLIWHMFLRVPAARPQNFLNLIQQIL